MLGAFVAVLLCSNLIGTSKVVSIDGRVFGAGILFFPLSYVLGDVLTEVYGYARSRRVVWAGFVVYPLAFWGVWPTSLVLKVMLSNYLRKVTLEAVLTPVTYRVVAWLKREEHEDFYDTDTDFTPFSLKA